MKWTVLTASALLALATVAAAAAAPPKRPAAERSADLLPLRKQARARAATPLVASPLAAAAAAPTPEEVGDADSFGRNVTWLGNAQTIAVTLIDDCTGTDPTVERCIVQQPAPLATTFDEADLATVNLPARATKSLLCFTLTPFIDVSFANFTGAQQTARFNASALVTIDNPVLDDPTLIDPFTGLPYNGSLPVSSLFTWRTFRSIQPGEFEDVSSFQTRSCIGGLVSKRTLVEDFGLNEQQANQFFRKPMTIHFGSRGNVAMSQFTTYFYGIRLFGD